MRTTDPDPLPFRPLGEKVQRPSPAAPARKPPQGGIVVGPDGRLRTNLPLPKD